MTMPWNDRRGRFSTLRSAALLAVLAPAALLIWAAATGGLGAEPVEAATHETGEWAIRFIIVTLAITPIRRATGWGRPIILRRMLGLAAAGYAAAHLGLYVVDQGGDIVKVADEIASRVYLTIGFVAVLGLAILSATSFDVAIRRMGRSWHRLHMLVYPIAALGIAHYFLQSKINASGATLMLGLFVLVMLCRGVHAAGWRLANPVITVGIAVTAAALTAGLEALWYGLATGVPWERVLEANLTNVPEIRPAWWVLAAGLALAAATLVQKIRLRRPVPAE